MFHFGESYLSKFLPPAKPKPNYFDTPDGREPFQKIGAILPGAFKLSLLPALHLAIFRTDPKTISNRLYNMARVMIPINLGTLCVVSLIYVSTRLRQKDDWGNYFIAGVAVGPIIQKSLKLPVATTAQLSLVLALTLVSVWALKDDTARTDPSSMEPFKIIQYYD